MLFPSPELAEFVGIMLGDGCIGMYNCHVGGRVNIQYRVKISVNAVDDARYARNVVYPLIERLFCVRPLVRERRGEKTMDILIFNKKLVEHLVGVVGLKSGPKHHSAEIPNWVLRHGFELRVLRGLFDTDGCLSFDKQHREVFYYPRLELKVSSKLLYYQLTQILEKHGFRYSTSTKTGGNTIKLQVNGAALLRKWVAKVGFNNPKHHAKYENWEKNGHFMR